MKVSATINDDLYKWMMNKIAKLDFYNRSHAIELGLKKLKEEEENSAEEMKGRG